ncbi:MAG: STAS domain-containing protein [Ruminococcus sp.]|nr:STAS domain-containing protein [Ruminococcus sp.]MBQ1904724.1 STAS domain-containing protein [Ruminococcus sp.]MBQ9868446.1 STAS domain-containing protein [Ruminococcus sp.]
MTVNKITNAGKTTLQVEGRVDTVTAPELEKAVNAAAEDTDTLVLDCEKLVYISSAGLRVLLSTHKLMTKKKGTFELINIGDDIMEIFSITGFAQILNIK